MHRILTITMNPAVDLTARVTDVVAERKLRCANPRKEPGGGGINVSRAIHRLDGESTAVFAAGGATGDILRRLLTQEGVEHDCVCTGACARENLTIFEDSSDRQYRFVMPGPALKAEEWKACLARLENVGERGFVVASGSLPSGVPDDFYAQVCRVVKRAGARFVLDTSGAPLRQAAAEGAYLLKPNAREFAELTGEPLESEEQQEKLARDVVEKGRCEILVLSLGAAGVLLVTKDGAERIRSPSVPITSMVGAGDSMVGAITLGLARDLEIRDAVCMGVAAGTAAVMTPGTELCRRKDVERLHSRFMEC